MSFWGICNAIHTLRVWARPSGRSLVKRFIFFEGARASLPAPARLTFNEKEETPINIFGAELRVKPGAYKYEQLLDRVGRVYAAYTLFDRYE